MRTTKVVLLAVLACWSGPSVQARTAHYSDLNRSNPRIAASNPAFCVAAHRVGQLVLSVTNNGTIGSQLIPAHTDCFTGQPVPDCEYPKNSLHQYLFAGALWIGAPVGGDTLVSVGADGWQMTQEMFPDEAPFGLMQKKSTLDPDSPEYEGAVSHEDYISVYTDTLTAGVDPDFFGRPHIPLNIQVTERSMAWSYPYTEDFVLFHYEIENIGYEALHDVYVGMYVDGDVKRSDQDFGYGDDVCGYIDIAPVRFGPCEYIQQMNTAWIADNDGDLGTPFPVPGATGIRLLSQADNVSFNWWLSNGNPSLDFGPRERPGMGDWAEPYRDFGTGGSGTPEGDNNKYYVMRNHEVDYDQVYTAAIQPTDPLWMYPSQTLADDYADGFDTRYLLSFGPYDIDPGEKVPLVYAYVGGQNLHTVPGNLANLPHDPDEYRDNLNFDDLITNSQWAEWVYDNPGVDTDSDGYAGEYIVCGGDTAYMLGDGVPDFRAAAPPPAPAVWLTPMQEAIHVRFNGTASETSRDMFSTQVDFEGYTVYLSSHDYPDFAAVASYDRDDYSKYVLRGGSWAVMNDPLSLEELRCLYGADCDDETFDPADYTSTSPYMLPGFPDSLFYFEPFGPNKSEFGVNTQIMKVYPDQPYPSSLNPSAADPSELTDDGLFKYFEYYLVLDGLLPNTEYHIAVTASDYGSLAAAVPPQEQAPSGVDQSVTTLSEPQVVPTYEWIDIYCENPVIDAEPLVPGSIISAWDPDSVLCGMDTVDADGHFGFMPVYRDDAYSSADEGAEPGDTITLMIDGETYATESPLVWTSHGDRIEVCIFTTERCLQFDLSPGWHLVSWNVDYTESVQSFVSDFEDCLDVILSFDQEGLAYDPDLPIYSTLDSVDYHHGYWLRLSCPVAFAICGRPVPESEPIPLHAGWNLISYLPNVCMEPSEAIQGIIGALQILYGFDAGYLVWDGDSPDYNNLEEVCPGFGYWLRMTVDDSLAWGSASGLAPKSGATTNELAAAFGSPSFMLLYGQGISLDGETLSDGTVLEVVSESGRVCGRGTIKSGRLSFMPVYGHHESSPGYPLAGDEVRILVDGVPVTQTLKWSSNGDRIRLSRLTSGGDALPRSLELKQNYPNPFNPTTAIDFSLPRSGDVELKVFNVLGQRVATLVDGHREAGEHSIMWNGTDDSGAPVTSGVYFYRLQFEESQHSRKMLLMK